MSYHRPDLLFVAAGTGLVAEWHDRWPDFGVDNCW
jgi:hypothetical protein